MKCLVTGLALLVATCAPGYAEDPTSLAPISTLARGTRLRMHLDDGGPRVVTGRLQDADDRSITVELGGGRSRRFSRGGIGRMEYRVGGRDRRRGGTIGGTITGAAGFVARLVAWERASSGEPGQGGGFICGLAGFVAAAPGFGIGFAIGAPDGHWRGVRPDGWTVRAGPSSRRVTVALHLPARP